MVADEASTSFSSWASTEKATSEQLAAVEVAVRRDAHQGHATSTFTTTTTTTHTSRSDSPAAAAAAAAFSQTWSFDRLPTDVSIRGGGCAPSLLCGMNDDAEAEQEERPSKIHIGEGEDRPANGHVSGEHDTSSSASSSSTWPGWAELENDPQIFTILLQDWAVPNITVNEVPDMADLIDTSPTDTLGLIFLSRYTPAEESKSTLQAVSFQPQPQPWFANQISKFSCGTVALLNILMNACDDHMSPGSANSLSTTLARFRSVTLPLSPKERGIALNTNSLFRRTHNAFSTHLDRVIVDVMLKDDATKHKQSMAAQARAAKLADTSITASSKGRKRKRKPLANPKRKRKSNDAEDDETGFHFIAYVPSNGSVWKLDGMQKDPIHLNTIEQHQTWLNVAAADLTVQITGALEAGEDCSMMSVTRTTESVEAGNLIKAVEKNEAMQREKQRRQEDWAPFIESMLRLHADKGDLADMLL